ncbi:hypothetical protein F4777DRAFT_442190 [Nemania sp. FL0916]|nr:hypothetical protein F4777DRAFT_442190 [Nemania sp. FL0916]
MPTSDPLKFLDDDDQMLSAEYYPFPLDFGSSTVSNRPAKENGNYMDLDACDEDQTSMFDLTTYPSDDSQHSGQAIADIGKVNLHFPSHRGSTSSSSSMRSGSSNSPHTSIEATPMDMSPSVWLEENGGSKNHYGVDDPDDFSQFFAMSPSPSSGTPPPPAANEASPDSAMPSETLPQGRANKRRKAQSKKPTSTNRSGNKTKTKGTRGFSPISTNVSSSETSPVTMLSNFASPDGSCDGFHGVFGTGANLVSTANGRVDNSSFAPSRSDPTYVPPPTYGLLNGSLPTPPSRPQVSSPPARLVIHPMPPKSRVETQIPLKITLHNLPKGITKVHLPTHTIAKPKLLQKNASGPSPDTLELTAMLVCTSAMNDETIRRRAFDRASAKSNLNELGIFDDSTKDHETKPKDGGEVRICEGCIVRERKRAGRKKHIKPEEEALWDRYERLRAIVFNTQEVKEWQTVTPVMADPTGAGLINGAIPEGTVQVDAPMRIACYCRHHGEKVGFQVIIILKDYENNIVAQGISSSIMITDDHKTPILNNPIPTSQPPTQSKHSPEPLMHNGLPLSSQANISQPVPAHGTPIHHHGVHPSALFGSNSGDTPSLPLRQTHSVSDLQSHGQTSLSAIPSNSHTHGTQSVSVMASPHSLSRQTSPASPLSAANRKRKASMVGKVPIGLTMTQMETNGSPSSVTQDGQDTHSVASASNSPFSTTIGHLPLNGDLPNQGQLHMPNNVSQLFGAGPTTPNGNGSEPFVFTGMHNGSMHLDRSINQLFSAPVSAHPSRAPSPSQMRPDPQNLQLSQQAQDILPMPLVSPPTILKIVPNEGSKSGGFDITILGSNFTNDGLEVYFGAHKAITTTYWGPTSLVSMLPPSPVSGPVPVTIKQQGRVSSLQQPLIFTYKDDEEDQLIRLALGVLASRVGRADPANYARSILFAQGSQPSSSGSNHQASHGNGNNNFASFRLESGEAVESGLLRLLEVVDLDETPGEVQIDLKRPSGQTMLHLACSLGFVRFVAALLLRGANVHMKDNGGFTPLHMAAINDRPEIVRRLIAKGADRNVQSRSGVTPIDVARSLPVRQSLQYADKHYRSRSVDLQRSRASSPVPGRTHWDPAMASMHQLGPTRSATTRDEVDWSDLRTGSFTRLSRRPTVETHAASEADEGPTPPGVTMAAIREQVATQLQQFQHLMAMHFQNLPQFQMPNMPQMPNLPPMGILPGYHAYLQSAPVMQRISSLVPTIRGQRQEPTGDETSSPTDNKWSAFPFFGTKDSPPPYEEIFPRKDLDTKRSSAAQAVVDFEADAKCAALFDDQDATETSQIQEVPALLQIGRKHHITKEQQETLQRAHAERLKAGSSDKMLWFVWIPCLILVLGLMLWSGAPSFIAGVASLFANPQDTSHTIVQEVA